MGNCTKDGAPVVALMTIGREAGTVWNGKGFKVALRNKPFPKGGGLICLDRLQGLVKNRLGLYYVACLARAGPCWGIV